MALKSEITERIYDSEKEIAELRRNASRAISDLQGMSDRAWTGANVIRDSIVAKDGVYEQGNLDKIKANVQTIKDSLAEVNARIDEILAL